MSTEPVCSGECLTGSDIGLPSSEVAYPHPDCLLHGEDWVPYDNEWSRRYVAAHPQRFPAESIPWPAERPWETTLGEGARDE
jgi:hypothetical protein